MFQGIGAQRLLMLFAAGWLALNFPLLGLWDRGGTLFGLPLLPTALFIGWALLIAAVAWVVERIDDEPPARADPASGARTTPHEGADRPAG